MKDFITKANDPAGDDSGAATAWGANESNSVTAELLTPVTTTGQTPTSGLGADTSTNQLARSMSIYSQAAQIYTDSGSANSYVLTAVGSYTQPESYFDGMTVIFKPDNANTGNSSVNVSTIGSKKILTNASAEVASGVITTDRYFSIVYDSTLDAGSGAFVLDPYIPRQATDTEVDNQTSVDAYVKPGQLGDSAVKDVGTGASDVAAGDSVGWESWQTPTYDNDWADWTGGDLEGVQYRRSKDGLLLQITGSMYTTVLSGNTAFTLPSGYRVATYMYIGLGMNSTITDARICGADTDGRIYIVGYEIGKPYSVNAIVPLDY